MLQVAPHAGAWIETANISTVKRLSCRVAPHAGAWIETRGALAARVRYAVAPHAGAWIETRSSAGWLLTARSRAPRGRVD